jgi:predicted metal-dependent hydrolase
LAFWRFVGRAVGILGFGLILSAVQFRLPFDQDASAVPAEPPVEFVRERRARRYILRLRPDGTLRITVPRGGSRAEALRFAEQHRRWIEQQRVRARTEHTPATWGHGTTILLRGIEYAIAVAADGGLAAYADRAVRIAGASNVRPAIEADLKALARAEVVPHLFALAGVHEVSVDRVLIRNQRSRWGSCSPSGVIALNFRLVQMPPDICKYVLLHELMHRREQNHSRRFWRLVAAACPRFRDAERWLETHGRSLF